MREINVYNPYDISQFENNSRSTKIYNKDHQSFFDDLTDELKKKYIVNEFIYENREPTQMRFAAQLLKQKCEQYLVMECDYVIEFQDTGEFYVLCVGDEFSHATVFEKDNPFLKKILISQFIDYKVKNEFKEYSSKCEPWIYFKHDSTDLETFYLQRQNKKDYLKKMFFNGYKNHRPILNFFDSNLLICKETQPKQEYFEDLINYSVGLSIGGVGEFCYRDVEYMCLGIPFIRFEYQTSLANPLIPNYHYISVPFDYTIPKHNETHKDRLGGYIHAKKIESRFMEIINNDSFLNFISANARKYYEDFLAPEVRVKNTMKILSL